MEHLQYSISYAFPPVPFVSDLASGWILYGHHPSSDLSFRRRWSNSGIRTRHIKRPPPIFDGSPHPIQTMLQV